LKGKLNPMEKKVIYYFYCQQVAAIQFLGSIKFSKGG